MKLTHASYPSIVDENRPQIKLLNQIIKQFNQTIENDPEIKKFYTDPQNCLQYIKGLSSTYNCQHDYIAKKFALEEAQKRSTFQQIDFARDTRDYGLGQRLYDTNFDIGFCMDWCYANLAEYVLASSGNPIFFAELLKNSSFDIYENFAYETPPCMLAMYLVTDLSLFKKIIDHRNFNPNFQIKKNGDTPILLTMVDTVFADLVDTICETIKMLVAKGADPRLANDQGITPLIRAKQTGFPKLIETIEEILKNKK